jgi:four helix bundle protein
MRQRYRELQVWQKSVALFTKIYVATQGFSHEAGLAAPMRRAAVAVFANIAEATRLRHAVQAQECIEQARAALLEIDTQLQLALRYKRIEVEHIEEVFQIWLSLSNNLVALAQSECGLFDPAESSEMGSVNYQPDPRDLEKYNKSADQEVYVPGRLGTGSGWNRHPALAE